MKRLIKHTKEKEAIYGVVHMGTVPVLHFNYFTSEAICTMAGQKWDVNKHSGHGFIYIFECSLCWTL